MLHRLPIALVCCLLVACQAPRASGGGHPCAADELCNTADGGISDAGLVDGGANPAGCQPEVVETALDLGFTAIGMTSQRLVVIVNRGKAICLFPDFPKAQGPSASDFRASFEGPIAVRPNSSLTMVVRYSPTDLSGPDEAQLVVSYEDEFEAPHAFMMDLVGRPTMQKGCALEFDALDPMASVDFGEQIIGSSATRSLLYRNVGSDTCVIDSVQAVGAAADAAAFQVESEPGVMLAPGEEHSTKVTYAPTLLATNHAWLVFRTSDVAHFGGRSCFDALGAAVAGCVAWPMTGTGVDSSIRVEPAALNLGDARVGCSSREGLIHVEPIGVPPTITSIRVEPPSAPIVLGSVALPYTMTSGVPLDLPVHFSPTVAQSFQATVIVETSLGRRGTTLVAGEGLAVTHVKDTLSATEPAKVDVLFIVDNSGSQPSSTGSLDADLAEAFVNRSVALNADLQVGVINMDMDHVQYSGRLQGSPKIYSPSNAPVSLLRQTILNLFLPASNVNVSSAERGLDAMVAALSPPLIIETAANLGFLRPDADLAVYALDDGGSASSLSVAYCAQVLRSLKPTQEVEISALTAPWAKCPVPGSTATTGSRYVDVEQALGGTLCTAGLSLEQGVDAFATKALTHRVRRFSLSYPADPAALQVNVNGVVASASAYTYDPVTKVVEFAVAPAEQGVVTFEYDLECL